MPRSPDTACFSVQVQKAGESMDQLAHALTQEFPEWMYKRPLDISEPFVVSSVMAWSDPLAIPPTFSNTKLCEMKFLPAELGVIHSIQFRGSFLNADGIYEDLQPEALFRALQWSIVRVSDNAGAFISTIVPDGGFDGVNVNGLVVSDTLSVQYGNMAPLVSQPGSQLYLNVFCLGHGGGPPDNQILPNHTRLSATISGYRVFFRPSRTTKQIPARKVA